MKFKNLALVLVALASLGLSSCKAPAGASGDNGSPTAQSGSGEGGDRRGKALARNEQTLEDVRSKKKTKDEVLTALRGRLEKRGGSDVDDRVKKVGAVIDEAVALDDAAFAQKKEELAKKMGQSMRGGGHRPGGSGKSPDGGGE